MKTLPRLAVVALAMMATAPAVIAQSWGFPRNNDRTGNWEGYAGLRYLFSDSVDFQGGSAIDTDGEPGFGFGFGYNFSPHLLVSGDFSFASVDYDGMVQSADTPGDRTAISGQFDVGSITANATWHFLAGPLTPFVSVNIGYVSVDTNIATGPPQLGCWWDPWYGYMCSTFVDTKTEDAFSYGLGVGGRWDFAPGWFGRLSLEGRWIDISHANGTPDFQGLRLDIGRKF